MLYTIILSLDCAIRNHIGIRLCYTQSYCHFPQCSFHSFSALPCKSMLCTLCCMSGNGLSQCLGSSERHCGSVVIVKVRMIPVSCQSVHASGLVLSSPQRSLISPSLCGIGPKHMLSLTNRFSVRMCFWCSCRTSIRQLHKTCQNTVYKRTFLHKTGLPSIPYNHYHPGISDISWTFCYQVVGYYHCCTNPIN